MYHIYTTNDVVWYRCDGTKKVVTRIFTDDGLYWSEYSTPHLGNSNLVTKAIVHAVRYAVIALDWILN